MFVGIFGMQNMCWIMEQERFQRSVRIELRMRTILGKMSNQMILMMYSLVSLSKASKNLFNLW